jgi:hypothetical protein
LPCWRRTIKSTSYYEKYLDCGKEIVLPGIGFDLEKRNIGNYLLETLPLSLSPDSTRKIKYLSPSSKGKRKRGLLAIRF